MNSIMTSVYYWAKLCITIIFTYQFLLNVVLRIGRYLYERSDRLTISSMRNSTTCSATNHIFQSMYASQVCKYVQSIAKYLKYIRLSEIHNRYITLDCIHRITRTLVLNTDHEPYIPWGDPCAPIQKELNLLSAHFTKIYVMLDETDDTVITPFNDISEYTIPRSIYVDCADLIEYVKIYNTLQESFEVIDIDDRVRLFVSMDLAGITNEDNLHIYYPYDNGELKQIAKLTSSVNSTSAMMHTCIVQIRSVYPWYYYDGSNSVIASAKYVAHKIKSGFDNDDSRKDVYYDMVCDAEKVFGFIRDAEIAPKIEVHMQRCMTVLAPQIYLRHSQYYDLKFRLVDPLCYPHSYYRLYMSLRNDNLYRIRSNTFMMNVLHRLGLIDMYLGPVTMGRDADATTNPVTNESIVTTGIEYFYTSKIRIILTADSHKYLDSKLLYNVLSTMTRVRITKS